MSAIHYEHGAESTAARSQLQSTTIAMLVYAGSERIRYEAHRYKVSR